MLFEPASITAKPDSSLFNLSQGAQHSLTYYYIEYNIILQHLLLRSCNLSSLTHAEFATDRPWPTQLVSRTPSLIPQLYPALPDHFSISPFPPDYDHNAVQHYAYKHDPREPHLNAMKRVLRYLRGTTDLRLQLFRSTTSHLIAYSDADWAGCSTTRRSTSGYCVFLGDNLLTWSSKRQDTLSRSSVEAEYCGVANAVAKKSWIRNLLRVLHTLLFTATLVYYDNYSAVYMSANPVQHQRTKHIEINIHFVRDKVAAGHVRVLHVPSRFQYVDIFTKGLPYPLFTDFRSSLSVRKSPAPTAGAY
ncbi:ribonuclease H-like domain-containing protein [Tanacetum coccineum]